MDAEFQKALFDNVALSNPTSKTGAKETARQYVKEMLAKKDWISPLVAEGYKASMASQVVESVFGKVETALVKKALELTDVQEAVDSAVLAFGTSL
jgi:predicted Ser/Thr protein kinase